MDVAADFKSYQDRVTSSLREVVRSASQISNQDLSFHRSSSDKVSRSLDAQNAHLLRLTNKLLKAASKDTSIKAPDLRDVDGVEDNWKGVVDVVDDLLEKADASLDEFTGVIKRLSPAAQDSGTETPRQTKSRGPMNVWSGATAAISQKPQLLFDRKVNNYESSPFKPLLMSKPHAIVSLEESIGNGDPRYAACLH